MAVDSRRGEISGCRGLQSTYVIFSGPIHGLDASMKWKSTCRQGGQIAASSPSFDLRRCDSSAAKPSFLTSCFLCISLVHPVITLIVCAYALNFEDELPKFFQGHSRSRYVHKTHPSILRFPKPRQKA